MREHDQRRTPFREACVLPTAGSKTGGMRRISLPPAGRLILPIVCTFLLACASGNGLTREPRLSCDEKRCNSLSVDCDAQVFRDFMNNYQYSYIGDLGATADSRGYALLIGIDDTNLSSDLFKPLKQPSREARRMKSILMKSGYAAKSLENAEATRDNIFQWLRFFSCISNTGDRILVYYSGHGDTIAHLAKTNLSLIKPELPPDACTDQELKADFAFIPYQIRPQEQVSSRTDIEVVVSMEISEVLAKSEVSDIIVLLDACSPKDSNLYTYRPSPYYSYTLKRQGYFFLSNLKEKTLDGQFSPIIFDAIEGRADTNQDGRISAFELVQYIEGNWQRELDKYAIQENRAKFILYGSGDMLLTNCR